MIAFMILGALTLVGAIITITAKNAVHAALGLVGTLLSVAGLFASLADERVLGTLLGWVSGFFFAVIFAVLAYLYYAVAVVLAMAGFGFAIGAGLVVALGIDWNWVAILAGLVVGAILGVVSVMANMPMIVLALVSAIGGAAAIVGGMMLWVGTLNSADFNQRAVIDGLQGSWGWSLTLVVLAIVGVLITALVYGVPKLARGMSVDDQPTDEVKADQKEFFRLLYHLLVDAERGPRLPTLFLALGSDKVRLLLTPPA